MFLEVICDSLIKFENQKFGVFFSTVFILNSQD